MREQMSTSVQLMMVAVTHKQSATTLMEISRVPACLDSLEMDSPAQVKFFNDAQYARNCLWWYF